MDRSRSRQRSRSRSRPPSQGPQNQNTSGSNSAGRGITLVNIPTELAHLLPSTFANLIGITAPQHDQRQPSMQPRSNPIPTGPTSSGYKERPAVESRQQMRGGQSQDSVRPSRSQSISGSERRRARSISRGPNVRNNNEKPDDGRQGSSKIWDAICEVCDQKGHRALRCPGPPDPTSGQIHACGFCGSKRHISEQCKDNFDPNSQKDLEHLEKIMLFSRRNLPMLACSKPPDFWPNAKPGMKYADCRPWTGDFALQYEAENPEYYKDFKVNRRKDDDLDFGRDPYWDNPDPEKLHYPLSVIAPARQVVSKFVQSKRGRQVGGEDEEASNKRPRVEPALPHSDPPRNAITTVVASRNVSPELPDAPPPPGPSAISMSQRKQGGLTIEGSFMTNCTNCGSGEHEIADCLFACGDCGSEEHKLDGCDANPDAVCVCSKFPRHLAINCYIICFSPACAHKKNHLAVLCTEQCCQCGACGFPAIPGQPAVTCVMAHAAINCPLRRKGCAGCNDPHVTSQCEEALLDEPPTCLAEVCGIWFCRNHCQSCYFTGHESEECPNTIVQKKDEPSMIRCPNPSHPLIKLGVQTRCPLCDAEKVAKRKANRQGGNQSSRDRGGNRGGDRGGNRGGTYMK